MDVSNVDCVVDSDINKQGFYTPISEFFIEDPVALGHADVVVITAVAYQNVILDKLKTIYKNFTGDVFLIRANGIEQVEL